MSCGWEGDRGGHAEGLWLPSPLILGAWRPQTHLSHRAQASDTPQLSLRSLLTETSRHQFLVAVTSPLVDPQEKIPHPLTLHPRSWCLDAELQKHE